MKVKIISTMKMNSWTLSQNPTTIVLSSSSNNNSNNSTRERFPEHNNKARKSNSLIVKAISLQRNLHQQQLEHLPHVQIQQFKAQNIIEDLTEL